jgi:hypothetical protein
MFLCLRYAMLCETVVKVKKADNQLGGCLIGSYSYKSKNTLIINTFMAYITYVCYEKDKHKADINLF